MNALVILKYIPAPFSDRKGDVTWSILRGHQEAGIQTTMVTPGRREPHEWREIDVAPSIPERLYEACLIGLSRVLGDGSPNGEPARRRMVRKIRRWTASQPLDIILAEGTSQQTGLLAHAVSRALGVPFVIRERLIYERTIEKPADLPPAYLGALRAADAVACVSPQLADILRRLEVRQDLECIPNPVSEEFFVPPEPVEGTLTRRIGDWAEGGFVFGGWTRWRSFKRLDLLLEAFARVRAECSSARLFIAGPMEPPMTEDRSRKLLAESAIADAVWLYGPASRPEIHQIAHAVDCCVVPSDYETFSLPALEALAAGKPVVATECNGPESLVTSERLGRLVPRNEPERLARAMLDIFGSRGSFDAAWIRRHTYARYSPAAVGHLYRALYERVLRGPDQCARVPHGIAAG